MLGALSVFFTLSNKKSNITYCQILSKKKQDINLSGILVAYRSWKYVVQLDVNCTP